MGGGEGGLSLLENGALVDQNRMYQAGKGRILYFHPVK